MINHVLISFSAVHIHDLSCIHLQDSDSFPKQNVNKERNDVITSNSLIGSRMKFPMNFMSGVFSATVHSF